MAVRALILQGADDALHHAVSIRRVRRDEFLLQALTYDPGFMAAARRNQAIVRTKQERCWHLAKEAVASDQSLRQLFQLVK